MRFRFARAALLAVLVFLALFLIRYIEISAEARRAAEGPFFDQQSMNAGDQFEIGRKNYASSKKLDSAAAGGQGGSIGDSQKYEKIGSLTQVTNDYDADRTRFDSLVTETGGMVQLERMTGLKGHRMLHLGIGVPPEKFDAFIGKAREIGKGVAIEVVKNDKTNEYLQLKAKRATLEKARAALEELKAGGGSTSERVDVQTRLTEVEQQIQDLGVSLGEFDSQNELCTVRLTLREALRASPMSLARRALRAFEAALFDYALLGFGFFAIVVAAWIGIRVAGEVRRLMAAPSA